MVVKILRGLIIFLFFHTATATAKGFNITQIPPGKHVTLSQHVMVPVNTQVKLTPTEPQQTISVQAIHKGKRRPQLGITISHPNHGIRSFELKNTNPVLYPFQGEQMVTITPKALGKRDKLFLRITSKEPFRVER